MLEIRAIGLTAMQKDGEVGLVMRDAMPDKCVVFFMTQAGYRYMIAEEKMKQRRKKAREN